MVSDGVAIDQSMVLPDSRMKSPVGSKRLIMPKFGAVNNIPLYCASCHCDSGWVVPEENCTFACYLCDRCAETFGNIAGTMLMPDEVFWAKVAEEQLNQVGRLMTIEELALAETSTCNPLSTLLREGVKG